MGTLEIYLLHNHINKIAEHRRLSITILEVERLLNQIFQMLELGKAR
jgi:hypothetical protein